MKDSVRAHRREQLERDGYVVVPEHELGLASDFRRQLLARYFRAMQRDQACVHADRERLRAVFRYDARDDAISLTEQSCVDIVNRNHDGVRSYPRVALGGDESVRAFVRTSLQLLPSARRPAHSTFSINLFRTRSAVTMGPHQDHERYVVVHLLRKVGRGAHTVLYDVADPARELTRFCLAEGDTLLLDDSRFLHHVTELVSEGAPCVRDALVCTVDHPDTYAWVAQ